MDLHRVTYITKEELYSLWPIRISSRYAVAAAAADDDDDDAVVLRTRPLKNTHHFISNSQQTDAETIRNEFRDYKLGKWLN